MTGRGRLWLSLTLMASCAQPPAAQPALDELPESPRFAVISSDYLSTSVAVLSGSAEPIHAHWLHSGSAPPGLATTLSGDVTLPTSAAPPGEFALIDRLGVDIITRVGLPRGDVLGQHHTGLRGSGIAAFRPNPHDIIYIDQEAILVSRSEPNTGPSPSPLNLGNDLIYIDLMSREITARIDLSSLNTELDGETIYARPGRMVSRGGVILVGLARQSLDFMRTGPGAIAIVQPGINEPPTSLALPQASGCAELRPVPGTSDAALVTCSGESFVDERVRRQTAALFLVRITEGVASVEREYRSDLSPDRPGVSGSAIPINETSVAVMGRDVEGREAYFHVDLVTGEHQRIYPATAPYTLGVGTFTGTELLLPDAALGILVRLELTGRGEFRALPPLELQQEHTLPPREVRRVQP